MKPVLAISLVFVACLPAGWLAGRAHSSVSSSTANTAAAEAKPSKARRGPAKSAVPLEVTQQLSRIRAGKTLDERLRATIHLAQTLPIDDLLEWYDSEWIDDGAEDMQSYLFYRTIRARMLESDPEALVDLCLRKDSMHLYDLARDWAGWDPGAALDYLKRIKDDSKRASLASSISASLAKADPQLLLSRIPELSGLFGPNNSHTVNQIVRELAKVSPDLLKSRSADWPESLRTAVSEGLAVNSLNRDFASGIAELSATKNGKQLFTSLVNQESQFMKEVARNPAALPPGWLDAALRSGGSYYLVESDPLKWLNSDLSAMGLSQNSIQQVQSQAISQLGSKDVKRLLEMFRTEDWDANLRRTALSSMGYYLSKEQADAFLASLSDPDEIKLATESINSRQQQQDEVKAVTPTSLLESLGNPDADRSYSQIQALRSWGPEQLGVLDKEFTALSGEQKASVAKKVMEGRYDQLPFSFQASSLQYFLENPEPPREDENPSRASRRISDRVSTLAANWVEENPTAASRWVSGLPAGEDRLWAAKNVAARWSDYEPSAANRWVSSLPAAERKEVEAYLKSGEARRF